MVVCLCLLKLPSVLTDDHLRVEDDGMTAGRIAAYVGIAVVGAALLAASVWAGWFTSIPAGMPEAVGLPVKACPAIGLVVGVWSFRKDRRDGDGSVPAASYALLVAGFTGAVVSIGCYRIWDMATDDAWFQFGASVLLVLVIATWSTKPCKKARSGVGMALKRARRAIGYKASGPGS